jgi:hypothetical protein
MPETTSHSIRDLRELFEALRSAAEDAIGALDAQDDGSRSPAFAEANARALKLAREVAAVQDAEQK